MTAKIETLENGERFFSPFVRKSTALSGVQWAKLDALAAFLHLKAECGPKAGEPGWRTLLRRIADGELKVIYAK